MGQELALSVIEPALVKVAEFEKRLAECGVECRSFSCAGKLHELKTAANAIKHGPGPAGNELAKLRPDPGFGGDVFGRAKLLGFTGFCGKPSPAVARRGTVIGAGAERPQKPPSCAVRSRGVPGPASRPTWHPRGCPVTSERGPDREP